MANTKDTKTEEREYRDMSYAEEAARDGALFCTWTQTWGLKVYTWYDMDKLKFSFVEKGKNGKGKSFDVNVNVKKDGLMCFEILMHEILHDIRAPYDFVTVMGQEKAAGEKYPKRYKFVTGNKAEKSVGICNSSNGGYCINGQGVTADGSKVFANIPVSFYDIYTIAQAFNETYESRRQELSKIREKGILDRNTRIKELHERVEEDAAVPAEAQAKKSEEKAAEKKKTPKADTASNDKKPAGIHVRTISDISVMDNGDYTFGAAKDDETTIEVRVPKDVADTLNKDKNGMFDKFTKKVNTDGTDFTFTGKKVKTDAGVEYIFAGFC